MRENVYTFAVSCGSSQLLQMLAYAVAPLGLCNPGAQLTSSVDSWSSRSLRLASRATPSLR
jgi:hypothetical protein